MAGFKGSRHSRPNFFTCQASWQGSKLSPRPALSQPNFFTVRTRRTGSGEAVDSAKRYANAHQSGAVRLVNDSYFVVRRRSGQQLVAGQRAKSQRASRAHQVDHAVGLCWLQTELVPMYTITRIHKARARTHSKPGICYNAIMRSGNAKRSRAENQPPPGLRKMTGYLPKMR